MNMFNVPKKVNRHVLKALNILSEGNRRKRLSTAVILNQVKFQMRDLVPVPDVDKAVLKSLKNLSDCGLIERFGRNRFSMSRGYAPPATQPPIPISPDRSLFNPAGSRKRSASDLDPNTSRRREQSEDSLSGDEIDRTRKRMHSNNRKLRRSGNGVILPKARKHFHQSSPFGYAFESGIYVPGYECNLIDHRSAFMFQVTDTDSEPVLRPNGIEDAITTSKPVESLQIIEITEQCQDSASCLNNQLTEASKSGTNIESQSDQNTATKEQTVKIPVSTSFVANSTKTTNVENGMVETSHDRSGTETLNSNELQTTNSNSYLN